MNATVKKGSYRQLIRNLHKHAEEIEQARKEERRKTWKQVATFLDKEARSFDIFDETHHTLNDLAHHFKTLAELHQ